jgi:hypothetical protein
MKNRTVVAVTLGVCMNPRGSNIGTVRDAGIDLHERISVADFLEEIEIGASIQANARGLHFVASPDNSHA